MTTDKVFNWFKQLGLEESAHTITDHNERDTTKLKMMVDKIKGSGEGLFLYDEDDDVTGGKKGSGGAGGGGGGSGAPNFRRYDTLVCCGKDKK